MSVIRAGHPPIKSRGIDYSNHHLQPFTHVVAGHGRDGGDIAVRVSFLSHVYSKSDSDVAVEYRFHDENGNYREFCPVRHNLSLTLPELCRQMIEQNYPTWISQDYNKKSHMAITGPVPATGINYAIFYSVFPSLAEAIDIEISIRSAYEKHVDMAQHRKRDKVMQIIKKSYYQRVTLPK